MTGTYKIAEIIPHGSKFACKVSFNGKPEEYWECDLDVADNTLVGLMNDREAAQPKDLAGIDAQIAVVQAQQQKAPAQHIVEQLQLVADAGLVTVTSPVANIAINEGGQIIL